MADKLAMLSQKVDEVLKRLEELRAENTTLKAENVNLSSELSKLKKEYSELTLNKNDQADAVRTRLASVLERLNQLEALSA